MSNKTFNLWLNILKNNDCKRCQFWNTLDWNEWQSVIESKLANILSQTCKLYCLSSLLRFDMRIFSNSWFNLWTNFEMAEAPKKVEIFPDEKGFFKLEDGHKTATCRWVKSEHFCMERLHRTLVLLKHLPEVFVIGVEHI